MSRPSIRALLSALREDAARYDDLGGWVRCAGFWAGATYRVGHFGRALPKTLRPAVMLPYRLINQVFRSCMQVRISPDAEIGPGLCLIHAWNVLLGPARIGANCLLFHEITIGSNAYEDSFPEVGDNVDIYAGARVLGSIRIGAGAKIGANCVVTSSIPAGATVVPAANRVIPAAMVAAFGPRRAAPPTTGASQT